MKYLKYFTKESDYQNYINGDSILRPNVSYSFESKDISFNAVLPPDPRKSIIGSIYLYDKINKSYSFCTQDELTIEKYPSEQYLPVGIVVIPASHDVYGTGECGIMSLMEMDYDNPELGSSDSKSMYWGNRADISELPNLEQAPTISTELTSNTITGVTSATYLPSTYFTSNKPSAGSGLDTLAGYYSTYAQAPSPYLEDGSRNPSYYSTDTSISTGLSANCLSDFNGVENTQIITNYATAQTDWKTASVITNSYDTGYYPAVCCCYRFNPDGNTAGQWYLPGMGELGYMIARFNEINNSINKIREIFGSSFGCHLVVYTYWSSTECSYSSAHGVDVNSGYVHTYNSKTNLKYVRAFLRA